MYGENGVLKRGVGGLVLGLAALVGAWNSLAWGTDKRQEAGGDSKEAQDGILKDVAICGLDEEHFDLLVQQIRLEYGEYTVAELAALMTEATDSQPLIAVDPQIHDRVCKVCPGAISVGDLLRRISSENGWVCQSIAVKDGGAVLGVLIEPSMLEAESIPKTLGRQLLRTLNVAGIIYTVLKRGLLP